MTTVYACSVHQLAKTDPREPWSARKYINAMHFQHRVCIVETTCYKCMEACRSSFNRLMEQRYASA
jgi:hypothetical protein